MSEHGSAAPRSLQQVMDAAGGPVSLLRNGGLGPYVFPGIPAEFTNWRDEMRAWKHHVALLEQSYHMCELHLRGPQALELISSLAVNKLGNFPVMRGKQLVLAGHDGRYIADAILVHEEDDFYRIVGAPFASDWVQFNASLGKYDVEVVRDDSWSVRQAPRNVFRIQIQGKKALELMHRVTGGDLPDIKFFHVGELTIAGRKVRALRHGMAGEVGYELYGPWEDQEAIRAAIREAGADLGLRQIGAHAYVVSAAESGWLAMPLPAIYHGEEMKPFREWLSEYHLETVGTLGGSFVSDNITDYYVDPIELGYGKTVDWDGDFVGRDALEKRRDNQTRTKRTLVWNEQDVMDIMQSSLFPHGKVPGKAFSLPSPMYATWLVDSIRKDGKHIGISTWPAYTANAESMLSLAVMDLAHAEPGTEVTFLWGEPNSTRASVEAHEVREIRATVAPAPYFEKLIKTGS